MAGTARSSALSDTTIGQKLALAIGVAYTLAGILGFFITGFDDFVGITDKTLLGFEINPAHNIVHLVIGLAGLALWRTRAGAKTYGILLAVGYGAAFLYGLLAVGNDDINFLSINLADNGLHIVSALAGVAMYMLADDRNRAGTSTSRR